MQSNSTRFGNKLVAVISRNGDLLSRLWLEVVLPPPAVDDTTDYTKNFAYVSQVGHALVKSAEVEIGGQRIDKIYGRFDYLWNKLTCKAEKETGYQMMTANDGPSGRDVVLTKNNRTIYYPLNFWFSKGSAGAALPLIALQYHEVRVTIELASWAEIAREVHKETSRYSGKNDVEPDPLSSGQISVQQLGDDTNTTLDVKHAGSTATTNSEMGDLTWVTVGPSQQEQEMVEVPRLYSDFYYLDTEERRRFSQMSHEYLIEQLQFTGTEVTNTISGTNNTPFNMRLNLNHPCKALIWTSEITDGGSFSASPHNSGDNTEVTYNGFTNDNQSNPFYNGWRPVEDDNLGIARSTGTLSMLHDNNPIESVQLQLNGHERFSKRKGSYFQLVQPFQHMTRVPYDSWCGMYSFCLSPEEHQPSGALNFSRIDNATLKLDFKPPYNAGGTKEIGVGPYDEHKRTVYVYAINYNVLRILSGMGGLAFSN